MARRTHPRWSPHRLTAPRTRTRTTEEYSSGPGAPNTPTTPQDKEHTMTNADLARLTELALMIADTEDEDTRD